MKRRLLLVLLSAILFSVGWYPLSGLPMLVGFIPLLIISRDYDASARSFWKMVGWVCLWMTLWYAMTVWWVWNATPAGPPAALLFGLIYTAPPLLLYHYVSKRAPRSLAYTIFTAAWLVGEFIYNTSQASFPWLNIGNGFAHDIPLVQWYEYTGIYGGTLWVLVANLVIYDRIVLRRPRRWLLPGVVVLLPIFASLLIWFTYEEPAKKITVSIVQPNIDPYSEKFTLPQAEQTANLLELASRAPADAAFVLMPETAIDESIEEGLWHYSPSLNALQALAAKKYPHTTFVVGATTYHFYPGSRKPTHTARYSEGRRWYDVYNSALAVTAGETIDIHHKSKLVIGVEMMPNWRLARWLSRIVVDLGGTSGQLGTDSVRRVFRNGEFLGGPAICYESIYGDYFADFVRLGANVMFVITNDGWWGNTPGYRQHFSYARLRAIENRRSIVRSANTGISGFISPRGEVLSSLGWEERGTLTARIAVNDRITFYTRYGDYLCRIAIYVLGLCILYFIAYRYRRRNHLVE